MNDEFNGYQQEQERLDMLIQEEETAAKEKDYKKAAELKRKIMQLRDELRTKVNELPSTGQQEKGRLERLTQEANIASNEEDYEKAAQLKEEIGRLRPELAGPEEQSEQLQTASPESKEHIAEAEIDFEIGRRNFVRAVMLAEQHQYPKEKVRHLQELALKQYALDYRNRQGLQKLIQWYGFSESEVRRVIDEGLDVTNA